MINDEIYESLLPIIREVIKRRHALNMTYRAAAGEMGIHWQSLYRYEKGLRTPGDEARRKMKVWILGENEQERQQKHVEARDKITQQLQQVRQEKTTLRAKFEELLIKEGRLTEALVNAFKD